MLRQVITGLVVAVVVAANNIPVLADSPCCGGHCASTANGNGRVNDMQLFHYLLDNRDSITRKVTQLPNGIDTLTEASDPAVVPKLQAHVASMYKRMEEGNPIHARDPLFAELFRHADEIKVELTKTPKGMHVVETSGDEHVAKLIKAHAEVVNRFLKYGHSEMRQNHEVPE